MIKGVLLSVLIIFQLSFCSGVYFFWKSRKQQIPASKEQSNQAINSDEDWTSEQKIRYPVNGFIKNKLSPNTSAATNDSLPQIEDIDEIMEAKWTGFFRKKDPDEIFIFEDLIRNIVVSVNSATGRKISSFFSPVWPVTRNLIIKVVNNRIVLSEKNYRRYAPYIELLKSADLKKITNYYAHIYPLFQSAYEELGKQGYFNDRLVETIDILLATPEVRVPIRLTHSKVNYEFYDKKLESLPAIQKILLRIGPKNAKIVKRKFKELRAMLIHLR